jgi:hypothetical protein
MALLFPQYCEQEFDSLDAICVCKLSVTYNQYLTQSLREKVCLAHCFRGFSL